MDDLRSVICPGMSLREVRAYCEEKMVALGADSFWYWDVGAFVFAGNETALSVSGRTYSTSDRTIAENDIITVDLSPQCSGIWGDFARTIVLEDGCVVQDIEKIRNEEWKCGLLMEERLHEELLRVANPEMSFEELHVYMNELIRKQGYVNLDFAGNVGHSIACRKEDRIYIEKGNQRKLGDVPCFTFEPHIGVEESEYGFKKENVYRFDGSKLEEV